MKWSDTRISHQLYIDILLLYLYSHHSVMNKFMFFLFPKLFHSKTHSISKTAFLSFHILILSMLLIITWPSMKYVDSEDGNVLVAYFIWFFVCLNRFHRQWEEAICWFLLQDRHIHLFVWKSPLITILYLCISTNSTTCFVLIYKWWQFDNNKRNIQE